MAGLAVNTISDAYPGAAPTAVGLAVFFVAAVPLELRRRWDAQGVADAGLRGHWGMSALARGVAPRAGTDPRPQLYVRTARFNTR